MEVAKLLGTRNALLLLGHGVVTTGVNLAESVTNMLQPEEQARMNYCAAGPDHPRIPGELIGEMTDRPSIHELPHFKDVLKGEAPNGMASGVIGPAWS